MPALPTPRPSAYFCGALFTLTRQTCAYDGDEDPTSPVLRIMPPSQVSAELIRAESSINPWPEVVHGPRRLQITGPSTAIQDTMARFSNERSSLAFRRLLSHR